ncbi:MAG: cation-translocating P-type ATPase [Ignavibacteriales bacterium]|nr:cation-translocating P-type ATPase [Ignavibacteriales bacterium]MCF8315982.1 cation-translocating P-type ATPase [Ignavibacteriales bacterium]MCF8437576.1 cation-translocating P-type ATPase [Ignavibacteriales bacterium]
MDESPKMELDSGRDDWYKISPERALLALKSQTNGITTYEAKRRFKLFGENIIEQEERESPWALLLEQFKSLVIVILIIAAVISVLIGQVVEAIAIIIIVVLAGIVGFIQEYQANKSLDALRKLAAPFATAFRDGEEKKVSSVELVPGDVITVKAGDQIPADCRLIEVNNLKIIESALTGESLPVNKRLDIAEGNNIPLGDRKNMLFSGTTVSYGRGKALVVGTAMRTEFGKIAKLLQNSEKRKTPLQENLDVLGKNIGIYAIILATVMSVVGVLRDHEIVEMFIWGVALAVAVIPEALPAVVTISIALGVRRMVKRKALIRKLPAVETLGSTNIICSDKTGTLTQDEMTVRKVFAAGKLIEISGIGYKPTGYFSHNGVDFKPETDKALMLLLKAGNLCNDTALKEIKGKWQVLGDPTEGALVVAAAKAGIKWEEERNNLERVFEIPFDSETKRMTTVSRENGSFFSYSKGAPEIILDSCTHYFDGENTVALSDEDRDEILNAAYSMGSEALRVLGVGYRETQPDFSIENTESKLVFAGLFGMIDPPRPEVLEAIHKCYTAGIKPIMITGDHKVTAVAVAKELGILKGGDVITGVEFSDLSDAEIDKVTDTTEVYARIAPEHKLKIVESLMKKGNIVTMTGDGINDAPSLKRADIGVAMGVKGTDVSREASAMILTDDNFASIVAAIEEGRSIFLNIQKYLVYLLSGNLGTVFAMIVALIIGSELPLMAVQILFINFLMDGLIAIALGVEPSEKGIMNHKPRNVKQGIMYGEPLKMTVGIGLWIGIVTMGLFMWADAAGYSAKHASTLFFAALIFSRLFNALNCRSFDELALTMNPLGNKPLLLSILISILFTLIVIYSDIFQAAFHSVPLSGSDWVMVGVVSSSVLFVVELFKLIRNKFFGKAD